MLSGIVYFEEIVQEVKDFTGYSNMRPLYDRIRRAVFRAETDIGAGGLIVRKKKNYDIGDGFYDGNNIILPDDFIGEYSHAAITQGVINGNIVSVNCPPGPDQIVVRYLGWLLDDNGNPFTTRNHLEAVVAGAKYRIYSSRYFLGSGNINQYQGYKQDYNDMILMSRGNDAFPTEQEWEEIGRTLNGGAIEAFSNCGLITCGTDNTYEDGASVIADPIVLSYPCTLVDIFNAAMIDQGPIGGLPTFSGNSDGISAVTGILIYKFDGAINTSSAVTGALIDQP